MESTITTETIRELVMMGVEASLIALKWGDLELVFARPDDDEEEEKTPPGFETPPRKVIEMAEAPEEGNAYEKLFGANMPRFKKREV